MTSVLVTGAAGFIGSHTCEKLLSEGHHVVGLDNFDPFYDREIKEKNLSTLKNSRFKFFEMDLESQKLSKALEDEDIEVVIHLAAKAGVRPSLQDPLAYVKANVQATTSLLEAMRAWDCRNLLMASSSSIYGKSPNVPFKENESFQHAISVYASTKQACELMTQMYHNLYHLKVMNLRFFTVYGPRQRPDLAIHKFIKANLSGDEITVFGDGSMARDYTYVDDTVEGIMGAFNRIQSLEECYDVYNLGNSSPIKLSELIQTIEDITGKPFKINRQDVPLGDVPITFAHIDKAESELSYQPKTAIKAGIEKMIPWIKETYRLR